MNAPRVYRVCGTPVRTGCITCKKRHVKCDEGKPVCKRCIKAKRTCEGYLDLPPKPNTAAAPAPLPIPIPSNLSLRPLSELPQAQPPNSTFRTEFGAGQQPTIDVSSLTIIDNLPPPPRKPSHPPLSLSSSNNSSPPSLSPSSLPHPSSTSASSSKRPSPSPAPHSTTYSLIPALTTQEQYHLHRFIHTTSFSLSGYSSTTTFYTSRLLTSLTSPSILHGCIALSALNEHFSNNQLRISLENPVTPDPRKFLFALRENNVAIRHLHNLMAGRGKEEEMDVTLMSCILFVIFDSFLGNYQSAMIHLRCGLQILTTLSVSPHPLAQKWHNEFAPHLLKLGVQSMMFLSPKDDSDRYLLWSEMLVAIPPSCSPSISTSSFIFPSPVEKGFHSIEDAEIALYALGARILHDRQAPEFLAGVGVGTNDALMSLHNKMLAEWDHKLKEYLSYQDLNFSSGNTSTSPSTSLTDSTLRTACLLKIYQTLLKIVIIFQPPAPLPPSRDPLFSEILDLCGIVDSGRLTHGRIPQTVEFSAELGIVAPLFFIGMKCSNMGIRQRALEMLRGGGKRREGMWDAGLCGEVLGKAIAVTVAMMGGMGGGIGGDGEVRDEKWKGWEECALHREVRLRAKLRMGS